MSRKCFTSFIVAFSAMAGIFLAASNVCAAGTAGSGFEVEPTIPSVCQSSPDSKSCDWALVNQWMSDNGLQPGDVIIYLDESGNERIKEVHALRDFNTFSNLGLLRRVKKFFFRKVTSSEALPLASSLDTFSLEGSPLSGSLGVIPLGMRTFMIWGSWPTSIDVGGAIPALPSGIEVFMIVPQTKLVGPLPPQLSNGRLQRFMVASTNDLGVLPMPLAQSLTFLVVGPTRGQLTSLPSRLETLYLWPGMTGLYPSAPDTLTECGLWYNHLQGVPSFWFNRCTWFPQLASDKPVFTSVEPSADTISSTKITVDGRLADDLGVVHVAVYVNGHQVPTWAEADFARGWYHFTASATLNSGQDNEIKAVAIDTSGQFSRYQHVIYVPNGAAEGQPAEPESIEVRGPDGLSVVSGSEPHASESTIEDSKLDEKDPGSQINWEWVRSHVRIPQPEVVINDCSVRW